MRLQTTFEEIRRVVPRLKLAASDYKVKHLNVAILTKVDKRKKNEKSCLNSSFVS